MFHIQKLCKKSKSDRKIKGGKNSNKANSIYTENTVCAGVSKMCLVKLQGLFLPSAAQFLFCFSGC